MTAQTPEQRILTAINSWPNRPWLFLPGPVDMAPSLAAHIAKALGPQRIETVEQLRAVPRRPDIADGPIIKTRTGSLCEGNDDGTWHDYDISRSVECQDVALPALLIWTPEAE